MGDENGSVEMHNVGTPMPPGKSPMPVMKAAAGKAKAKARVKAKAKAKAKVSSIAKGELSKVQVYKGTKKRTGGGLKKEDLVKSKTGKVVSAKMSAHGKNTKWAQAFTKAREEKGYTGFKSLKKGTSFYAKT